MSSIIPLSSINRISALCVLSSVRLSGHLKILPKSRIFNPYDMEDFLTYSDGIIGSSLLLSLRSKPARQTVVVEDICFCRSSERKTESGNIVIDRINNFLSVIVSGSKVSLIGINVNGYPINMSDISVTHKATLIENDIVEDAIIYETPSAYSFPRAKVLFDFLGNPIERG